MLKFGLLVKLVTVFIFASILYFIINYIVGELKTQINFSSVAPNLQYFLCVFGVLNAINVFVSLFIAGWFTNKILNYLST